MGKRKVILGGIAAAAAGYLYYKHKDAEAFDYDATFETEVEVVEGEDGDEDGPVHVDHEADASHDPDDEATYDDLMHETLSTIQSSDQEQTNVYAVEPYDSEDGVDGTPSEKYDDLEGEPDLVVSSFAGRSLMVIVRSEADLADTDAVVNALEEVSRPGFSVLLIVPDTPEAREHGDTIKESFDEGSLFVETPADVVDVL